MRTRSPATAASTCSAARARASGLFPPTDTAHIEEPRYSRVDRVVAAADGAGLKWLAETFESDDRGEEVNVLGEAGADEEVLAREHLLAVVRGREERRDSGRVRLPRRGGPGLVHSACAARGVVSSGRRGDGNGRKDGHALEDAGTRGAPGGP